MSIPEEAREVIEKPTIYVRISPNGDVDVQANRSDFDFVQTIGFLELAKQKLILGFMGTIAEEELRAQQEAERERQMRGIITLR